MAVDPILLETLKNTKLSNPSTKKLLGRILRKEFDAPETSYEDGCTLTAVALQMQLPIYNEMFADCQPDNFKSF